MYKLNWPRNLTKTHIFGCYKGYGNEEVKIVMEAPIVRG